MEFPAIPGRFNSQLPADVMMMRADVVQALVKVTISLVFMLTPTAILRLLKRLRGTPISD